MAPASVLGYSYRYNNFGENNTGRVTFADNVTNGALRDGTLDRSWYYDDVGRLNVSYTGSEARATIGTDTWGHPDGPYAQRYDYDVWGNRTHREGWGGIYSSYVNDTATFTNNQMTGLTYDAAGNFTANGMASYDASGQQVAYTGAALTHAYDGDRLRGKRVENGTTTYHLRSSVLGGQVICELNASGGWNRGYVYLGGQLLAIQYSGAVTWVHQEPTTKGQRFTDSSGNLSSTTVEVDPWGGNTTRSVNSAFQPHLYTSYERDSDVGDEAMMRRYAPNSMRFSQPDPYDGSYDATDPQSFNRYSYAGGDSVNFVDPSGLLIAWVCGTGWVNGEPANVCGFYHGPSEFPGFPQDREPRNQREPQEPDIPRKEGVPPPKPDLAKILSCMQQKLNSMPDSIPLFITATTNGRHSRNSAHYRGDAADLRYNDNGTQSARRLQAASDCGAGFALDEGRHPSAVSSAPHYHIQIGPGRNGSRGDLPPPSRVPIQ